MDYHGEGSGKLRLSKHLTAKLFAPLFLCTGTLKQSDYNRAITIDQMRWNLLFFIILFLRFPSSVTWVKHSIVPFKYLLVCINYNFALLLYLMT